MQIRRSSPLSSPSHYGNPNPTLKIINLASMNLSGRDSVLLRRKHTLFLEKLLQRYSRSNSPAKVVYPASIIRTILLTEADSSASGDAFPHETEPFPRPFRKPHKYKVTNFVIDVPEKPLKCISDSLPKNVSDAGGWKSQMLKKRLASMSGRSSQHRLHLVQKSVGSAGPRQKLGEEESRVAVVNLTYQQRGERKTEKRLDEVSGRPGKFAGPHPKASHRPRRRDMQLSDLAVTPSRRPVEEAIEETESPGLDFVTPRSTSCTPLHWETTTVTLPSKLRRRTVFTHKVSEVPKSCGEEIGCQ